MGFAGSRENRLRLSLETLYAANIPHMPLRFDFAASMPARMASQHCASS